MTDPAMNVDLGNFYKIIYAQEILIATKVNSPVKAVFKVLTLVTGDVLITQQAVPQFDQMVFADNVNRVIK